MLTEKDLMKAIVKMTGRLAAMIVGEHLFLDLPRDFSDPDHCNFSSAWDVLAYPREEREPHAMALPDAHDPYAAVILMLGALAVRVTGQKLILSIHGEDGHHYTIDTSLCHVIWTPAEGKLLVSPLPTVRHTDGPLPVAPAASATGHEPVAPPSATVAP